MLLCSLQCISDFLTSSPHSITNPVPVVFLPISHQLSLNFFISFVLSVMFLACPPNQFSRFTIYQLFINFFFHFSTSRGIPSLSHPSYNPSLGLIMTFCQSRKSYQFLSSRLLPLTGIHLSVSNFLKIIFTNPASHSLSSLFAEEVSTCTPLRNNYVEETRNCFRTSSRLNEARRREWSSSEERPPSFQMLSNSEECNSQVYMSLPPRS